MLFPVFLIVFMLAALFFFYSTVVSYIEKEKRAASSFFVFGFVLLLFLLGTVFLSPSIQQIIAVVFLGLIFVSFVLFFFQKPYFKKKENIVPRGNIDERDTMFSRDQLEPGSKKFKEYYQRHPEHKEKDDAFRKLPGLLSEDSMFYEPDLFAAADANFKIIEKNRPFVDGPPGESNEKHDPEELSLYLKELAKKYGAYSTGITRLKNYHLYSYRGRKHNYGQPVENNHEFALAFTVEMNRDFIRNAPNACCILESSQKYVDSGIIANLVAQYLRDQGYPARAHIDGEYEVVCPLVARDANLGEIGRMGLLMTPKLGPMVRIAVVTTSAPLVEDRKNEDLSVVDFCRICKKCAEVCPSQAIAFTDRKEIKGVTRWQINQEACFTYWCKAGTDCARCVSVCPFAHPDNFLHNVVRYGIRNSKMFQKFALKMDNLIYGRKPARLKLPKWNRNDREE
jgi:ferredoxin